MTTCKAPASRGVKHDVQVEPELERLREELASSEAGGLETCQ